MRVNVAWHVCENSLPERSKRQNLKWLWEKDRRNVEVFYNFLSFLFACLFVLVGIFSFLNTNTALQYLHFIRLQAFLSFFQLIFPIKYDRLHFYNSASLSLCRFFFFFFLLLWRANGEKTIQYTGYWSTPITAEKKSVQGVGERRGTGHSDR